MLLTDSEIEALIAEPKPEVDPQALLGAMRSAGRSQRRATATVTGDNGSTFQLSVRQNELDGDNFSAILSYVDAGTSINLRRHNGPSHDHPNKLEETSTGLACHAHMATQRYQAAGFEAEGYAEARDDFVDLAGALRTLLAETGFRPPAQGTMI